MRSAFLQGVLQFPGGLDRFFHPGAGAGADGIGCRHAIAPFRRRNRAGSGRFASLERIESFLP